MIFCVAYFWMCNCGLLKFKAWLVDFFSEIMYNIIKVRGAAAPLML